MHLGSRRIVFLSGSALVSLCCAAGPLRAQSAPDTTTPAPQQTQPPAQSVPALPPAPAPSQPQAQPQASPQAQPGAAPTAPSNAKAVPPAPADTQGATPLREIVVRAAPIAPRRRAQANAPRPTAAGSGTAQPTAAEVAARQNAAFDQARDNILPKTGTTSYSLTHDAIAALPQGTNAPLDKVLLQAPGVSQDSAASGALHVRNEHANLQYRINGILLPDGVSGFGQVMETSFIGSMALVNGALPAQYGLHTSGLLDITTRVPTTPGGSIGIYGGSQQEVTPSFEYGGTSGKSEYFISGRYFTSNLGIENPTSSINPIHDYTQQSKLFAYASTIIDDSTRITFIGGNSFSKYQIPNNPNATPAFTAFGFDSFDPTSLNERQWERNNYAVLAMQKKVENLDLQVAYFNRYSSLHFAPDVVGDVIFNGVASDVQRRSMVNGMQADAGYRVNDAHTVRGGMFVSGERTDVINSSTVLPLDMFGDPIDAPFGVIDSNSKTGWLAGGYVQDEWRINRMLTLNAGLRFDQMYQFVNANQVSPRVNVVFKPLDGTTIHAGYARYFTPPSQAIATPVNLALVQGTTAQPEVNQQSPVLPERSSYYDVGITQDVLPGLKLGVDAYYKVAKDLLDDGQFGAALVLSGFNYARGVNRGVEFSGSYVNGDFNAYGNVAWARQVATDIVSNQFLFGADELAYIANNYVYTDHAQTLTVSGGASYLWWGTRYSATMIYGSGLRSGDFNLDHVPSYTQVNVGASREFELPDAGKYTVRFDVVNLFDRIYEIRDGSGIGVFAPQFGPRRGYFIGLSRKI